MNKIELKQLIESYPNKISDLRKIFKEYMQTCTTEYESEWKSTQKIYHEVYLNSQITVALCPVCNRPLRFTGLRKGYTRSCSASCRNRNPEFLKKYKKACLSKYGTEFASQSTEFRSAVLATNISKCGVDNPFKSEEVRQKHKAACMEKYGVDNPSKSPAVIEKIKQSRIASGDWIADAN